MTPFAIINKKHLKNVGPIRHCQPLHAACFTLPFTRCRHCRTPPAHRCPQQHRQQRQQRQRVTEGTAMAPWNGPNKNYVATRSRTPQVIFRIDFATRRARLKMAFNNNVGASVAIRARSLQPLAADRTVSCWWHWITASQYSTCSVLR